MTQRQAPRIGIVSGSTRGGRFGDKPAHWFHEIAKQPIGFVGYGGVGAARAVEQLRLVSVELQMAPVRHAVHIGMVEFFGIWQQGKRFEDFPHLAQAAKGLLYDTAWWAKTLKTSREAA